MPFEISDPHPPASGFEADLAELCDYVESGLHTEPQTMPERVFTELWDRVFCHPEMAWQAAHRIATAIKARVHGDDDLEEHAMRIAAISMRLTFWIADQPEAGPTRH